MNEKKRVSTAEQSAIYRMAAAKHMLNDDTLDRRIRGTPNGARDLGLLRSVLRRLYEATRSTVPPEQLRRIDANMRGMVYNVGIRPVADHYDETYGRWVSFKACGAITDALKDHCMTCSKDHNEQKRCPLREALEELPIEYNDADETSGCRFFTMWAEL